MCRPFSAPYTYGRPSLTSTTTIFAREAMARCQRLEMLRLKNPFGVNITGLEDEDVRGVDKAAVIIGDFSQIAGNIVAKTRVVFLSVVAAEMPVVPLKVLALWVDLEHCARTCAKACADFHIPQFALRAARARSKTSG